MLVVPAAGCADGAAPDTGAAADPVALSRERLSADADWRKHVLDVPGRYVRPESVSVKGDPATVAGARAVLAEDGKAATLRRGRGDGRTQLIVDLGVMASGYVELGVRRSSGAKLRAAYAEGERYLDPETGDGSTDPKDFFYRGATPGMDDDPDARADTFGTRASPATLRSPGLRGAQRYIAISLDGPGTAEIDFVRVRQTQRPGRYDGHFLSSDETLNRAWYASAYGTNLSVARDRQRNREAGWIVLDGPKRDRVPYAGDLQIAARAGYYQSADYRQNVRNTISLFACQQKPDGTFPLSSRIDVPCDPNDPGPPDGAPDGWPSPELLNSARLDSFTAWWVIDLAEYLRYTGDEQFARAMLPAARRAVAFFASHATADGLFTTAAYDKLPAINWHPPNTATGIDAYTNAAYHGALTSLAELERAIGAGSAPADRLDQRAAKIRTALLEQLWDDKAGAMILNDTDPRRDHTADATTGALIFGLLDERQARRAMHFLATDLGTPYGTKTSEHAKNPYMTRFISPYLMAQEALGRFRYGDDTGALALIRRAWGHMDRTGPGTPWEQIQLDGTAGGAGTEGGSTGLAHAWSTAVPALSQHVLGVRPTADGYRRWSVAPRPADLRWAQGRVPTPHGTLAVNWKRTPGSFTLTTRAPAGTTGQVALPLLGRDRTIAMDGRIVWRDGKPQAGIQAKRSGDTVVFTALTGTHTLAWA
ncbi:alpha-L-rhamnosidase C-terminal domain-containing protein [Streptomyces boninensis]|uniref:alpha-L-rhamnosidase C-terminal domain-containing protein n=1 Tax=Streptomyces boninensis TaxID=2039455 RepID=UPI003B21FA90